MLNDMPQPTVDERAIQAARNNAVWCEAVYRAHGKPGTFLDEVWLNLHEGPRFYPNLVTLRPPLDAGVQLATIRELVAAKSGSGWGVKDSFRALDLNDLGFQPAFDAEWIWRDGDLPAPSYDDGKVRWSTVRTPEALTAWEAAWDNAPEVPSDADRIFLPPLLRDPDIVFVAGYLDARIAAGAIANRTGTEVGISNIFVPSGDSSFLAGCIANVMQAFPGLPIVGYERGDDLTAALAHGFQTVGPLRIWLKS